MIKQLSKNVFEIIPKEGIVVDKECVGECWKLWDSTREEPFGLLINCKNHFSWSFEGSRDMAKHPLIQKTVSLCNEDDDHTKNQLGLMLQIREMSGHYWSHKIFTDRIQALKWLSDS
jgi:hypothetical protein